MLFRFKKSYRDAKKDGKLQLASQRPPLRKVPAAALRLANLTEAWLQNNELTSICGGGGGDNDDDDDDDDDGGEGGGGVSGILDEKGDKYSAKNKGGSASRPLAAWTNLELLYAFDNDLVCIPAAVGALVALEEVNFSGNARISSLPSAVAAWRRVKQVYLNKLPLLTTFPPAIGSWLNVKVLRR
jgi:hypothetical protein